MVFLNTNALFDRCVQLWSRVETHHQIPVVADSEGDLSKKGSHYQPSRKFLCYIFYNVIRYYLKHCEKVKVMDYLFLHWLIMRRNHSTGKPFIINKFINVDYLLKNDRFFPMNYFSSQADKLGFGIKSQKNLLINIWYNKRIPWNIINICCNAHNGRHCIKRTRLVSKFVIKSITKFPPVKHFSDNTLERVTQHGSRFFVFKNTSYIVINIVYISSAKDLASLNPHSCLNLLYGGNP
ncbi:hypothetical protein AGLY_009376 [Aphis glycines]|uniref:Uncharacterized protein n=1 Tax=Aphis glycines TaxID=307491 RepID=A0A6G0TI48_APHGL|nr:hypothetical protein AGLY_009376 [Aphis glycines]